MISWGLEVNDYGNASMDADKNFTKVKDAGVSEELWADMLAYAADKGLKGGDFKKLNLPFENKIISQSEQVRERMAHRVADFVYTMLVDVFNGADTAAIAIDKILTEGTHDPGPKAGAIDAPEDWTKEKIIARAAQISSDKGPEGDFDD